MPQHRFLLRQYRRRHEYKLVGQVAHEHQPAAHNLQGSTPSELERSNSVAVEERANESILLRIELSRELFSKLYLISNVSCLSLQRNFNDCILSIAPITPTDSHYAVSTAKDLFFVNNKSSSPLRAAGRFLDGTHRRRYYALKWAEFRRQLLVGGTDKRIDVFTLNR